MKLNEYLKKKRLELNLTQKEISKSIGISFVTYNHIESNKNYVPSFKTVYKIANFYKTDVKSVREMLCNTQTN